ncbi:MAG: hypothetical protein WA384_02600, partial [Rhodomicrobium sp.]
MTPFEPELQFPQHLVAGVVRAALEEDLGLAGDITTNALIPADAVSEAILALREDGRIAGLPLAIAAFRALDPQMAIETHIHEGALADRYTTPVQVDLPGGKLGESAELTAYFVIAESITNAIKHADASEITVTGVLADGS